MKTLWSISMAEHALLSASSSSRWINCPACVKLEKEFPEKERSPYAKEGTEAHALAEAKLLHKTYECWDADMDLYTDLYVDYVTEVFNETHSPILMVEHKVKFDRWVPEGFGTADVIIVSNEILHIIDFKYGQNVAVSAVNNTQLKLYAAGAYESLKSVWDFDKIKVHIFQPRMDIISTDEFSVDDLLEEMENIKIQAHKAFGGCDEFKAGKWCMFCKAKATCKKRAEYLLGERVFKERSLLSHEDKQQLLLKLEELKKWTGEFEKEVTKEMLEGEKYDGFKLVESRTNRVITDELSLIDRFEKIGISQDELFKDPQLKPLGQLEKLAGGKKAFNELSDGFVKKPKGYAVIAPSGDKRKEFISAKAEDDFADELNEE